jgi:hypothetical protein
MPIKRLTILAVAFSLGLCAPAFADSKANPKPAPKATSEPGPYTSDVPEEVQLAKPASTENPGLSPEENPAGNTKPAEKAASQPEGNKFLKLAEQAVAGDAGANTQIMKAVDDGNSDAKEALDLALNAKLSRGLQPKVEKGDLDAMQNLIKLAKKGDPSARKALDKAYQTLAAKAVAGDKKSNLALEFAAQEGEDAQSFLDQATKAKEKKAGKGATTPEF